MALPATLLDAVTGTGAGSAFTANSLTPPGLTHKGLLNNFSVVITFATATPTAATVILQGSLDNSSWVDLGQTTDVSADDVGFSVANKPFLHLRGNLSVYTAGSCTGVTVKCVGVV